MKANKAKNRRPKPNAEFGRIKLSKRNTANEQAKQLAIPHVLKSLSDSARDARAGIIFESDWDKAEAQAVKDDKTKVVSICFDKSQLATVLTALRLFQNNFEGYDAEMIRQQWPDHFQDVMPLGSDDIDTLCEEINCSLKPIPTSEFQTALDEVLNLGDQDICTDAWEYKDRVKRMEHAITKLRRLVTKQTCQCGHTRSEHNNSGCFGAGCTCQEFGTAIDALCEEINCSPKPPSKPMLGATEFVESIARMKTEEELGEAVPPSEDWISMLNELIVEARELASPKLAPKLSQSRKLLSTKGRRRGIGDGVEIPVAPKGGLLTHDIDAIDHYSCKYRYHRRTHGKNER